MLFLKYIFLTQASLGVLLSTHRSKTIKAQVGDPQYKTLHNIFKSLNGRN